MSSTTTNFNLVKPAKTDSQAVSVLNGNMDIIDTQMHLPPLTVNGISPDSTTRDLTLETVPFADNLSSDVAQYNSGSFIQRTSGGDASIGNGTATLVTVKGNYVRNGYVAESLNMTVNAANEDLSATIDRDTFVAYVSVSSTITLTYSSSNWSASPALYGITVTGTPTNGDSIVVVYVKEDRGTIVNAVPSSFNSTGWNLYSNSTGRARVIKYSNLYGFRIDGSYTSLAFAETTSGTQTSIAVTGGNFQIPSDGFVFVTGGDATTCIYETWSDWTDGYDGDFEPYTVDTIDLSEIMLSFPYGLCKVGNVADEINFSTGVATRKIDRTSYDNIDAIMAADYPYIADTNYVYYELPESEWVETSMSSDGEYTVSDHGIEFYSNTSVPIPTEILYEENLKDKLRRDVVTISEQSLTDAQKEQVRENIGAASAASVSALLSGSILYREYTKTSTKINGSGYVTYTAEDFNITPITGYTMVNVQLSTTSSPLVAYSTVPTTSGTIVGVRNISTSDNSAGKTLTLRTIWVKNELLNAGG